jgi:hypothetical protein
METGKLTGETHYACREIVAERDALRAERDSLRELEALLFDGYAVYLNLPDEPAVTQRTSYSNVADTLDALHKAWHAALEGK